MPAYRCFAWVFKEAVPPLGEVNDTVVVPTFIFAATRPAAITLFVEGDVIPENNARPDGPYPLDDISIGVDVVPEVPNWQP